MPKHFWQNNIYMKDKVSLEKKIELLENAAKNRLTEDTVKNLAKEIRIGLIREERYEDCIAISKVEKTQLARFKEDREKLVRNVGLNEKQMEKLFSLV